MMEKVSRFLLMMLVSRARLLPAGVGREYVLKADIRSKNRLDGKEAITLKIDNQPLNPASESATARIDNFENCVVPGVVENVNASGVAF